MVAFELELLPDDPARIESSREILRSRAQKLAELVMEKDTRLQRHHSGESVAREFSIPKSWTLLEYFDGGENARLGAQSLYSTHELQEVFTVAVNGALLTDKVGFPGFCKGHSILRRMVANNPESMYQGAMTPAFKKRLTNGTFWEEVHDLTSINGGAAYRQVNGVLTQEVDDLDLTFVPRGLKIFERNVGQYAISPPFYLGSDGPSLSEGAILAYGSFMKDIDAALGDLQIDAKRLAPLVQAYIETLRDTDRDGNPFVKDPEILLREPFLARYKSSGKLKVA